RVDRPPGSFPGCARYTWNPVKSRHPVLYRPGRRARGPRCAPRTGADASARPTAARRLPPRTIGGVVPENRRSGSADMSMPVTRPRPAPALRASAPRGRHGSPAHVDADRGAVRAGVDAHEVGQVVDHEDAAPAVGAHVGGTAAGERIGDRPGAPDLADDVPVLRPQPDLARAAAVQARVGGQ